MPGSPHPGILRPVPKASPEGRYRRPVPMENVRPPGALLMLSVRGLGPPKRPLQVRWRRECRASGVDPAGKPRRDLLDKPRIAVWIGEGAERPVAGTLRVGTGLAGLDGERRAVPDVTRVDATADELVVSCFDVGDDQPSSGRAGSGRGESHAERDRRTGPGTVPRPRRVLMRRLPPNLSSARVGPSAAAASRRRPRSWSGRPG